jgi:hypothetical protein
MELTKYILTSSNIVIKSEISSLHKIESRFMAETRSFDALSMTTQQCC